MKQKCATCDFYTKWYWSSKSKTIINEGESEGIRIRKTEKKTLSLFSNDESFTKKTPKELEKMFVIMWEHRDDKIEDWPKCMLISVLQS